MTASVLPHLQGPTRHAFPSGVHSSFTPSHIPPIDTPLFPPSLLPPGHHSLLSVLFSPATPHILQGPGLAVGTAELENRQFLTTNKKCQWLLYTSAPLLAPSGGVGTMEWVLRPQALVHLRPKLLLLVDSEYIFGACGMYQVPPCGDTENGLLHKARGSISKPPSLPYIGFSCPL